MLNTLNLNIKNKIVNQLFKQVYKSFVQPVLFQIQREKLLSHRLIFCISSGRCGSNYLAELLGTAKEVKSYHEAVPKMDGRYLHMINRQTYNDSFQERYIKNDAIKNRLLRFPKGRIYCETNHMFIKTFFDVVLSDFKNVDVIILRRELALVLKSFIQLNYFSEKNDVWPNWMSNPDAKTAALRCIGDGTLLDQFDLCIAYLFDIEARALRFQSDYPWVRTHEVRVESLSKYYNVQKLFFDLSIAPTIETKKYYRKKINLREERKKEFSNDVDLDYCKERITIYVERAKNLGISLPNTLAFAPYSS